MLVVLDTGRVLWPRLGGNKINLGSLKQQHYAALDSLRGICALAVVVFHFRTTGNLTNLEFFRHSWMFVDFFFVLSGFVIAAAYGDKLQAGTVSVRRFMGLRLGRIYPLHIAMVLALLFLELLLALFDLTAVTKREAFEGSRSLPALATNLGILHVFGLHDRLTWNIPSWSIAAEIWAYLVFAVVLKRFGHNGWQIIAALGVLAMLVLATLAPRHLNATYDFGFVRCLYGFAVGTLTFRVIGKGLTIGGTMAEAAAVFACVLFVTLIEGGLITLAAPLVFALPVLVFARGEGYLTRVLTFRPFVWLGTISYSIYMVHGFVQGRIGDLIQLVGEPLGLSIKAGSHDTEYPSEVLDGLPLALDILTLIMLAMVIVTAAISYRTIERPFREMSRAMLSKPTARRKDLKTG